MDKTSHQSKKSLRDLLKGLVDISELPDLIVTTIQTDSRLIEKNSLFVALKGTAKHGLLYLPEVIKSGAVAVLYDNSDADHFSEIIEKYKKKPQKGNKCRRYHQTPELGFC